MKVIGYTDITVVDGRPDVRPRPAMTVVCTCALHTMHLDADVMISITTLILAGAYQGRASTKINRPLDLLLFQITSISLSSLSEGTTKARRR